MVLAGLSFDGWLSPALILALTFLLACGTAVNWPAMQVASSCAPLLSGVETQAFANLGLIFGPVVSAGRRW